MREPPDRRGMSSVEDGPFAPEGLSATQRAAWDELVEEHGPVVWRAALRVGFSLDEAALISRLAWLHLAQVLPRWHSSKADVHQVLLDVLDREVRVRDARLRRAAYRSSSGPVIPSQAV